MHQRGDILLLLTAFLLSACTARSDPIADARQALAAGDKRLVGYMGVGLIVPGTPANFQYQRYVPGVRVLPDVTDTSLHAQNARANEYASRYNKVILSGGPP